MLWPEVYDQPLAQRSHSNIYLGRSRFNIDIWPLSCVSGSSPLMELSSIFFWSFFPYTEGTYIVILSQGSNSWLAERLNLTPVSFGVVVRTSVGSIRCQLDGSWLMVQCPVKNLFCFKSDTPYQILSLSRGSFSLFFSGYNSTNPVKEADSRTLKRGCLITKYYIVCAANHSQFS